MMRKQPFPRTAAIALAALILAGVQLHAQGPAGTAPAQWDAKCIAVEVPEEVLTDQVFIGKITVKNTGSAPWSSIPYAGEPNPQPILYSQAPTRNKTWGTDFAYVGQGKEIGPGKEFTFVSGFKGPGAPGEYGFQWRLARQAKDGKTVFFGEPTVRKVIRVRSRPETPRPSPPARDPAGKKVLGPDDFQYVGSFRLPERVGESGAGYSEIGIALRKTPGGTRHLLVNYTHPRQTLFEIEIPPLAQFDGLDPKPPTMGTSCPVAEVKKVWGSLVVDIPKIGDLRQISPNGGLWWDDGSKILYWTYYHGYWTGGGFPVLSATRLGDDGKTTSIGRWRLPQTVNKWKSYWGGVMKLPADFARKYTGGRTMALGFGGYYSICAGCSRGPALAAIAQPDPRRDELDVAELLCYPDPAAAPRDGDYFYGLGNIWYDVPKGPNAGRLDHGRLVPQRRVHRPARKARLPRVRQAGQRPDRLRLRRDRGHGGLAVVVLLRPRRSWRRGAGPEKARKNRSAWHGQGLVSGAGRPGTPAGTGAGSRTRGRDRRLCKRRLFR